MLGVPGSGKSLCAKVAAYAQKTELGEEHLADELQKTRPLSVLQAERVAQLPHWAKDRCVPAD